MNTVTINEDSDTKVLKENTEICSLSNRWKKMLPPVPIKFGDQIDTRWWCSKVAHLLPPLYNIFKICAICHTCAG